MCISIPPKFAVSSVVGFMKGKSAISIARNFLWRKRNFTGESFWARGYFVSTVGLDEEGFVGYHRHQPGAMGSGSRPWRRGSALWLADLELLTVPRARACQAVSDLSAARDLTTTPLPQGSHAPLQVLLTAVGRVALLRCKWETRITAAPRLSHASARLFSCRTPSTCRGRRF